MLLLIWWAIDSGVVHKVLCGIGELLVNARGSILQPYSSIELSHIFIIADFTCDLLLSLLSIVDVLHVLRYCKADHLNV